MLAAKKIGLLAGSGALPHAVIAGAIDSGYDVFVVALDGFGEVSSFSQPAQLFRIGELGRLLKTLKREKCTHVVMAGQINRPDFKKIKPDLGGMKYLPKALAAAAKGDDALLRFILEVFEKEGFSILAPQEICNSSLMPSGLLGKCEPTDKDKVDIEKALDIAAYIGAEDIGQAAVVCNGLVLAVEAQEGTDKMLERVAALPVSVRGTPDDKLGVLAKCLKPAQEDRIDLPTIGVETIKNAHHAGLSGVALKAGEAFVLDLNAVRKYANSKGLFVIGIEK